MTKELKIIINGVTHEYIGNLNCEDYCISCSLYDECNSNTPSFSFCSCNGIEKNGHFIMQQTDVKSNFKIDRVEKFWFFHNRNFKTFKEITFWYNPETMERKETSRCWSEDSGGIKPEFAENITEHNKTMDYKGFY